MASIRDVAQRAGVGIGTVSRVMNGTGRVSEETRRKVEMAIRELDYTPNELARNLNRNRSGIVGLLVPNCNHPYFAGYVQQVEATLYEAGYKTLIGNTIAESNREKEFLEMLDRNMVDGVIMACHTLDDKEFRRRKRPIVSLERDLGTEITMISSDHQAGGRMAAEVFLQNGCKRVLNISGESPGYGANLRHSELDRILRAHGVEVVDYTIKWNTFDHESYRRAGQNAYHDYPDMDGVFGTDQPLLYYLREALRAGRRVPEDLKAIAYDGTSVVQLVNPQPTYIYQDVGQLAEVSANAIVDLIEGRRSVPNKQIIPVRLVQGETTLPVTLDDHEE